MKAIKNIFLGCVVLAVVAFTILAITAGVMVSLGPPNQHREEFARSQELDTPRLPPAASQTPAGEVTIPSLSVQLRLDLKEGEFRILPGNPGDGIRIEANYDSGIYALEQEHQSSGAGVEGEAGVEKVTIRFYSKYSKMRRLVTLGGDFELDNRIKIYLPPDIPINLIGTIGMGESRLDLSGLPLTGLDLSLTMGDHEVQFDEPNPLGMEKLHIYTSKGEFTAKGLGNAGFQSATVQGSMGEVTLDLCGEYIRDASVRTRFRMGALRITVPEDIHVNVVPSSVTLGEQHSSVKKGENIPDDAPSLSLQTSMSMGELRISSR